MNDITEFSGSSERANFKVRQMLDRLRIKATVELVSIQLFNLIRFTIPEFLGSRYIDPSLNEVSWKVKLIFPSQIQVDDWSRLRASLRGDQLDFDRHSETSRNYLTK